MLIVSLGLFTVVALIGIVLARDIFVSKVSSGVARFFHVCFACAGSVLVIIGAFRGDERLWINIGLPVVIVALGVMLWYLRSKGQHPKGLVLAHGGIAVICYLILAYLAFTPR